MGFIVPVIKAVAAVVAKSVVAKAVVKIAAAAIISKVATKAISKLIAKRADIGAPSGSDAGARIQLPPAADNKLPIVYGTSWVGGPVIDAKISTDQKFMWYVIALSEKPAGQTITFDTANGVYYGGKKVQFGSNGVVNALVTNTTPAQVDTKMAGKIYIWLFQNDANSAGVNTTQTPYQIMTDSSTGGGIPDGWNTSTYTDGGQSVQLNNMAYAIVRVEYNVDATTTSLDTLQIKLTNNMGGDNGCKPGVAILDYLTNERYGCAIPLSLVDTASLTALDAYSDEYISYVPVGGGSSSQRRYRVNGPLDTGNDCLTNLQFLVDTCDSWLQYTETSGKWRIVPNKPYTGALSSLFNVNANNSKDCNVVGGIQINPIDLNDTYNQVEVAYPNTNVKDQTDYQTVDLTDPTTAWYATFNQVLSPNEAINRLNIALPLVNNAVQAKYLAVRRLLQSREDLVISCQTDYSGIQIDAGDVIRVNHSTYGWTDKLFRVNSVSEVQDEQGNLSALIEAFEYNGTIYTDNAIQDFVPADNTGLKDPNVISPPCPPTFTPFTDNESLVTGFNVTSCVPDDGIVIYMDFNYGNSSNVQTHQLYKTVQNAGGIPFINSDSANGYYNNVTITVNDLMANTYYWSTTARNDFAGRYSDASSPFNWGGANINPWDPNTGNGGIIGNQIRPNTVTGNNIAGNTITGNNIQANTITGNNIQANTITGNNIAGNTITGNNITANTITGNNITANTITANNIQEYTILSNNIANYTITNINIANGTLTQDNFSNTVVTDGVLAQYAYVRAFPTVTLVNTIEDLTLIGNGISTFAYWASPKSLAASYTGNLSAYPFAVGDANTSEGYSANSISPLNPGESCQFVIYNEDYGWYASEYKVLPSVVPSSRAIYIDYYAQAVSSSACRFQISPYGTLTSNPANLIYVNTQALRTYNLIAEEPIQIEWRGFIGANVGALTAAGIIMRNWTGTPDIIITNAVFRIYETEQPTG